MRYKTSLHEFWLKCFLLLKDCIQPSIKMLSKFVHSNWKVLKPWRSTFSFSSYPWLVPWHSIWYLFGTKGYNFSYLKETFIPVKLKFDWNWNLTEIYVRINFILHISTAVLLLKLWVFMRLWIDLLLLNLQLLLLRYWLFFKNV